MAHAQTATPPPTARLGPRPLSLHLTTAVTTWLTSAAALPLSSASSPPSNQAVRANRPLAWHPSLRERGEALGRELAAADPKALAAAVGREVRRRLDELERGLQAYRHHPYRRELDAPPVVWSEGTTRLLDYGALAPTASRGAPLLVVPSLINRAYILDLWPGRSLLRALAAQGFRPYLVDWGQPGAVERRFDLSAYIAGRLGTALDQVASLSGRRPAMIGYCMGGLLALALARLRPRDVAALLLLATPWDFHAEKAALGQSLARTMAPWLPLFDRVGELPVDFIQTLFAALDPFQVVRKFSAFARLDAASSRAMEFVALEDWLNDGVALSAPVARDCLVGWYGENTPARGEWRVAGHAIRPEAVRVPALVVVPEQDRIVPPASAMALARALPKAKTLTPSLGHIGMVTSARAPGLLWPALARWLRERLAMDQPRGL